MAGPAPAEPVAARDDPGSRLLLIAFIGFFAAIAGILAWNMIPSAGERAAHDAEQRLALVRSTGDKDAICAAARQVAQAWLDQLDQAKYQRAKLDADIACLDADSARRLRYGEDE